MNAHVQQKQSGGVRKGVQRAGRSDQVPPRSSAGRQRTREHSPGASRRASPRSPHRPTPPVGKVAGREPEPGRPRRVPSDTRPARYLPLAASRQPGGPSSGPSSNSSSSSAAGPPQRRRIPAAAPALHARRGALRGSGWLRREAAGREAGRSLPPLPHSPSRPTPGRLRLPPRDRGDVTGRGDINIHERGGGRRARAPRDCAATAPGPEESGAGPRAGLGGLAHLRADEEGSRTCARSPRGEDGRQRESPGARGAARVAPAVRGRPRNYSGRRLPAQAAPCSAVALLVPQPVRCASLLWEASVAGGTADTRLLIAGLPACAPHGWQRAQAALPAVGALLNAGCQRARICPTYGRATAV